MLVLVTYDVSTTTAPGRKRLARVAKTCEGYGMRVQYSVFECEVDPGQWERLKQGLLGLIEPTQDSLRFYFLGSNWERRVEHHGAKPKPDTGGLLMV
ncbi:MAG: CRISPR-associated endonuclease Cas2 [Deltaproteobacteria bacterium HGW-Deltaproteobacteria-20]|jgi:CRISPR-associated protein Cas2|nr:MAG: CRISPR-associated endonuclease Cas2 [Deltaproteobacteria bacterium HGW-Deltaproteobacteria-20]